MLLSAVSVLVVAQSSSEIPEGLMNNPVILNRHVITRFLSTDIWAAVSFLELMFHLIQVTGSIVSELYHKL